MCTKVTLLCLGVARVRVRACLGFCSSAKGLFSLSLLQLKDKFLVAEGASTWATHGRRVEDCRFLFGSELKEMSIIFPNNSVMHTGTDGLGDYTWKHTRSGTEGPVPRWDKPVRCVWSRCTGMWRMTEPITTDPFFFSDGEDPWRRDLGDGHRRLCQDPVHVGRLGRRWAPSPWTRSFGKPLLRQA